MENRKQLLEAELKVIQSRMKDIWNIVNGEAELNEDDYIELMWEHRLLSSDATELIHEILNL